MKQKSLSQMNKERDMKPMTKEEEYKNADVPMPKDEEDYSGGKAYTEFLKFFFKGKKDE
jgi:hypothetical protein